ncbi:GGDEF domain-containing protein [Actinoplanes sp. NPDC049596]|uniref:GGDEF domain-containing protein n=1 Tax=unclassified Actinoplanes TaxID=2626549 RepID=UPI003418151B
MSNWKRPVPAAYLCLALLYAVALALSVRALFGGLEHYDGVAEAGRSVFGLIGLVAAVQAARASGPAWRAVALSFLVLVVSPVLALAGTTVVDDVTHVAFVVSLIVALQFFVLPATTRRERAKAALDASIVLVGGSMLLWYFSFGGYIQTHGFSGSVIVPAAVYPIADLALLFSVARVLLRGTHGSAQRPLRLLTAGALVLFAGDAVHGYLRSHGQIDTNSPWQFICWLTADALLAAAAVAQCGSADARRESRRRLRTARYLPFAAIAVANGMMLIAAVRQGSLWPWGGLALGGAVMSAIVLARQTLVQQESDERAVTDGLTGLANRVPFRATSNRALDRDARAGKHTAVMVIDLNSFKGINDTLGHKSGDLVLVEFARVLRECVPGWGLPCRLGGDEFAVVLPGLDFPEQAYDVAGRIASTLAPIIIDGKLIPLAASIGIAVSAPGELTHDVIVHRADLAMYRAKAQGPQTRWAVWQEHFESSSAAA